MDNHAQLLADVIQARFHVSHDPAQSQGEVS